MFQVSKTNTMTNKLLPILGLALLSCNAEKQLQKAETRLSQAGRLASICADRFPSRDSIIVKDSVTTDTLLLGEYIFDTIRVNDTIVITKKVPVVKTMYKILYKFKERTDKIEAVQLQLEACNNEFAEMSLGMLETQKALDQAKKDAKFYFWWLWVVIVVSLGWTFRKLIARYVIR
jgi:hypothetical protein